MLKAQTLLHNYSSVVFWLRLGGYKGHMLTTHYIFHNPASVRPCFCITIAIACNSCLFISGVFFISGVEFFTVNNRKMHTFDLLIVKGDTLRLLIVKCVSYD